MFRDLYAAELEYLHGLAEDLGREQGRIAPMLGRGADPGVSRLVQGVAFLSARVRQRLDDDLPDVIHPIVESLCPWLLQPMPAATILELVPNPAMQESQIARAGSTFSTPAIEGPPCIFRSSHDVDVRPWKLDSVEIANERTEIRLRVSLLSGAPFGATAGALRLFLAMPIATALDVRSFLQRSTQAVFGAALFGVRTEIPLATGEEVARACARLTELGPHGGDADPRFALRAYFAWPEQFAFVDLPNVERLATLGDKTRVFEIIVRLSEPLPKSLSLDASKLRMHCVPVVNVHRPATISAPLVVGRCSPDLKGAELFAVEKVSVIREDLSTIVAAPYASFFPASLGADGRLPLQYRVARTGAVVGAGLDVGISFVQPDGGPALPGDAVSVDLDLLVTDGERATRVGLGDLRVPTVTSPALVSFRNITPVSRTATPALEGDRLWLWLQMLKTNVAQLADVDTLAAALALANVAAWARWPQAKANSDSFEALRAVRTDRLTRAGEDEVFAGMRIDVDLDEGSFAGRGDLDLFGDRLLALFAGAVRTHEWVELTVRDAAGLPLFEYAPRFGTRGDL